MSFETERSPAIAAPEPVRHACPFADRGEAGRFLAAELGSRPESRAALLLASSARALPVARAAARLLGAPLDIALVRRIRLPGGTSVGAVARGVMLINESVLRRMRVEPDLVEGLAVQAGVELAREEADLRSGRPPEAAAGRTAILVDDGLGDPGDWIAASRALRRQGASGVWLAAPALDETARALVAGSMDEILTAAPAPANGRWYADDEDAPDESATPLAESPGS